MSDEVREVSVEGKVVGRAFHCRKKFCFILEDERDQFPRFGYETLDDAVHACSSQALAIRMADRMGLMVDT